MKRARAAAAGRLVAAFVGLVVALAACTESRSAPTEREDRAALAKVVDVDLRASQAMRAADDAATKGDAGAALAIVAERATPAIDEGLAMVAGMRVGTDWGKRKRDALADVLRDRKAEMPRYAAAVKSGEPERMLLAVEAQAAIERRALGTVAELKDGR